MAAKIKILFAMFAIFIVLATQVMAIEDEEDDWELFGVEVDELITAASSLLAIVLFAFTAIAYRRDGRKKLLYVSIAFLLFAVKGLLLASELILPEKAWVDPIANIMDFAILLIFFFALMKK